jgi:hypothetical protein
MARITPQSRWNARAGTSRHRVAKPPRDAIEQFEFRARTIEQATGGNLRCAMAVAAEQYPAEFLAYQEAKAQQG